VSEQSLAVENVLAAVVESQNGVVKIPVEIFKRDFSRFVLAIDYDAEANELSITLVDKETAVYEDE